MQQALIALPLALPPLTYSLPEGARSKLRPGAAVTVPLRNRVLDGYIVGFPEAPTPTEYAIKQIEGILPEENWVPPALWELLLWISDYYHYPLGAVIEHAMPEMAASREAVLNLRQKLDSLPAEIRSEYAKRGGKRLRALEYLEENPSTKRVPDEFKNAIRSLILDGTVAREYRVKEPRFLPLSTALSATAVQSLNDEQAAAAERIESAAAKSEFLPILLEGITGSGKTEVYLSAAEHTLRRGGGVLILVPEIALTPQLFARVRARLGDKIALLHSALTPRERNDQWRLLARGDARVALGARSSIFAPIHNLRLIVVDEEHETAFKQEDRLRYNARDLAIVRAQKEKAVIVLGSATPSLESMRNAASGKYEKIRLTKRHADKALPKVSVVDMCRESPDGHFTPTLRKAVTETLAKGEQVMLFLNRRGTAGFVQCEACGHTHECRRCSVSLTLYQKSNKMICHYCAHAEPIPHKCAECGEEKLRLGSPGTESLETQCRSLFPAAKILRIDREVIQKRGDLEAALGKIAKREVDLILGTQMIAKGHDFPGVSLVGVVNADLSLNLPDFRASERTFQLLTQVSGRAGRGEIAGRVLVQTYNPQHPAIQCAISQDPGLFAESELETRMAFHYPPFHRLARVLLSAPVSSDAERLARRFAAEIGRLGEASIEVLGPAPAVLQKIQDMHRWSILLKASNASLLHRILKSLIPAWRTQLPKTALLQIDVDPVSLL